ncbi:MAG: sugar phosphate isomerase/epimerase family protein [Desulfopila sp.]
MLLGLHTYSLHHHGIGESWAGFNLPWERQLSFFQVMDFAVAAGLDGLHLEPCALDSRDDEYLGQVNEYAKKNNLYLEYTFGLKNAQYDSEAQHDIAEGVHIAHKIGAPVAKVGLNLWRPHPIGASIFHKEVMAQLEEVVARITQDISCLEGTGVKLALENHTDTFADEILWVLDQVNHSHVGACIDTVNGLHVTENPLSVVQKLAPRAFTNHFRDNKRVMHSYGFSYVGCAVGDGDIDMIGSYELIRQNPAMKMLNIELDLQLDVRDKEKALAEEKEAILRSVGFCRKLLKGLEESA